MAFILKCISLAAMIISSTMASLTSDDSENQASDSECEGFRLMCVKQNRDCNLARCRDWLTRWAFRALDSTKRKEQRPSIWRFLTADALSKLKLEAFDESNFATDAAKATLKQIDEDVAVVAGEDEGERTRLGKLMRDFAQSLLPRNLYTQAMSYVCFGIMRVRDLEDADILAIMTTVFKRNHKTMMTDYPAFASVLTDRLLRYHGIPQSHRKKDWLEIVSTFLSKFDRNLGTRMIDIILTSGVKGEYAVYASIFNVLKTQISPDLKTVLTSNIGTILSSAEQMVTSPVHRATLERLSSQTRTREEWADWILGPLSSQRSMYLTAELLEVVGRIKAPANVIARPSDSTMEEIETEIDGIKKEWRTTATQVLTALARRGFEIQGTRVFLDAMKSVLENDPELMKNILTAFLKSIPVGQGCLSNQQEMLKAIASFKRIDLALRFLTVEEVLGPAGVLALRKSLEYHSCHRKENSNADDLLSTALIIYKSKTHILESASVTQTKSATSGDQKITLQRSPGATYLIFEDACMAAFPWDGSALPAMSLSDMQSALKAAGFEPCGESRSLRKAEGVSYAPHLDEEASLLLCEEKVVHVSCLLMFGGVEVRLNRQISKTSKSCDEVDLLKEECENMQNAYLVLRMVFLAHTVPTVSVKTDCGLVHAPDLSELDGEEICQLKDEELVESLTPVVEKRMERYFLAKEKEGLVCGSSFIEASSRRKPKPLQRTCDSWNIVIKSVRRNRWLREKLPKRFTTADGSEKHSIQWTLFPGSDGKAIVTFEGSEIEHSKHLRYRDTQTTCQITILSDRTLSADTVHAFTKSGISDPCGHSASGDVKAQITEVPYYACFIRQRVLVLSCTALVRGQEIVLTRSSDLNNPFQNGFTKRMTVVSGDKKSFTCNESRENVVAECNKLVDQYMRNFSG